MTLRTTREVAELCGVAEWQVRRLFELGILPDPPRFAGKRAIPPDMLPTILDALRARGYIGQPTGVTA